MAIFNRKPSTISISINEKGFSLIEALIATALIAIGFTSVLLANSASEIALRQSIARQKLQMQADQIINIIDADHANIDSYNFDFNNCPDSPPDEATSPTYLLREYEWCQRMNSEVIAPYASNPVDHRTITISNIASQPNQRIVDINLEAYNQKVQIAMKRIFNVTP